jgi:RNA polymerase sigma factor (sigma-70 family)
MGQESTASVMRHLDALFDTGTVAGLSDEQLLERYARGHEEAGRIAFEAILRRHGPMVLGVCRRVLGDHHETEDAFQATFLVLAFRGRSVRNRASLGPWLHGVALRVSRRARASRCRNLAVAARLGDLAAPEAAATAQIDLHAALDEELGRLPSKYRLPLVLCYLEGRTQEEAARELGWTKGTVSGRVARAKDLLRLRLGRRGLAPSVVLTASGQAPGAVAPTVPVSLVAMTARAAAAIALGRTRSACVSASVLALLRHARWAELAGGIWAVAVALSAAGTLAVAAALASGDPGEPTTSEAARPPSPAAGSTAKDGGPSSSRRPEAVAETEFFSIVDRAGSFAYVIDRSGSMTARGSLDVAKHELLSSLSHIPPEARFAVIFYNNSATVFTDPSGHPGLMPATPANKARVRALLSNIDASLGTDHMLALRAALELKPEVIFFLTDADLMNRQEVAALLAEVGKTRIHVIEFKKGVGEGNPALRRLAVDTGGRCRVIDINKFSRQ